MDPLQSLAYACLALLKAKWVSFLLTIIIFFSTFSIFIWVPGGNPKGEVGLFLNHGVQGQNGIHVGFGNWLGFGNW